MNRKLTEADLQVLEVLPDGWFRVEHLPINRPAYRCERLFERGQLRRRVVGTYPDIWSEYRKFEGGAA